MRPLVCLIVFVLIPLSWCKAQPILDSVLDARPNVWWGSMVVDLASGDTLYMRNAERSFMPASVTKLYTTSAVLDQLGPDYRYVTMLYADGTIADQVLEGNLIVRGAGDPTTGAPGSNSMDLFHAFADSLLALGIQEISGNLIGDDNIFDDTPLGRDWSWEDLPFGYAAQISGLTFHEGIVNVDAYPTAPGEPARLSVNPDLDQYLEIINHTLTLPRGEKLIQSHFRIPESNRIIVSSEVPMARSDPEALTVNNPTLYFIHGLREVLATRGILVRGQLLDVDDLTENLTYSDARIIARHSSSPMAELVAIVNKKSQNLYAEHLLKTLGREHPLSNNDLNPGSAEMGIEAAKRTYARAGIDTSRIHLVDGSGLSRKNLVTPAMTIALLRYMASHPDTSIRDSFLASLAVAGKDGTLEFRFTRNSPAHGYVIAKTGTIGNVSALSGYIMQDHNSRSPSLAFVIFANHYQGGHTPIRRLLDSAVNALINFSH